ncbi:MAG TPA: VCBS repeat-containing protein [Candidatus Polarisedimenticolia bacterium]|nr:VCBS repeat-containing protein [Candidatus Polarisedimenticolia bacterium]
MKRASFYLPFVCLGLVVLSLPTQSQVSFFQPPTYGGAGNEFVFDFNGDGKPDILTSDGTMNLGNGDGTFRLGTPVSTFPAVVLAVGDFNGDGKPDVLEQGTGTLLVLLGNGDGTFQAPTRLPAAPTCRRLRRLT